jgi:hypothetical protein
MILNTYLKTKGLNLTKSQKSWLGQNIIRCYKSLYKDAEIKKVGISEKGCKIQVVDYPKEFLESFHVKKIVKNFTKKHIQNAE